MNALVSILIPCYNARRWIGHAIESALAQSWGDKQVIVVDDGSSDGSREIIAEFEDSIRWETGPNKGGGAARNRLLELASGEWIQYLDADDYLLPDKIAHQMAFVASRPHTDVVFGPVTIENWSDRDTRRQLIPIPTPHDLWILMANWGLPQTGAPLWRKQAIVDVGGWKRDQPCLQEHELYLRLLMAGKRFAYCSTNGAVYRQWSEDTVCKRDMKEVLRRRLEIEQRLEDYLRHQGLLTPARQRAISQARFETARTTWRYDADLAYRIMNQVRGSDRNFSPTGPAAPPAYRAIFHTLGFRAAERIAEASRKWRSFDSGHGGVAATARKLLNRPNKVRRR
jgi:glycosyltransferase involved in cell wall biosynthesis